MNSFIEKIKSDYLILRNILRNTNKSVKFLFYSENKSYQKFSIDIIDVISKKYPNQILYVSSDREDKIDNINVKNLYIGQGLLMKLFFLIIKAENFFLTLTDLGNHSIKKTKNINKYIYYFHAAVSTFKNYTNTAFDNYDVILCSGKFQINEIRKREKKLNLPKKELIKTGYFYFDYLKEKISLTKETNHILIAPSWNYDLKNFINENHIKVIDTLLKNDNNVIFRPHPEHFKRSSKILNEIKIKFNQFHKFIFDESVENLNSMEKAKCLITDASGIALEYLVLFKRPILYLSDKDKIHNKDFSDFKDIKSIDHIAKDEFGYKFYENDINEINSLIDNSIKDFQSKVHLLDDFTNNNFFNFGSTKKKFDLIIDNQIINNKN